MFCEPRSSITISFFALTVVNFFGILPSVLPENACWSSAFVNVAVELESRFLQISLVESFLSRKNSVHKYYFPPFSLTPDMILFYFFLSKYSHDVKWSSIVTMSQLTHFYWPSLVKVFVMHLAHQVQSSQKNQQLRLKQDEKKSIFTQESVIGWKEKLDFICCTTKPRLASSESKSLQNIRRCFKHVLKVFTFSGRNCTFKAVHSLTFRLFATLELVWKTLKPLSEITRFSK